MKNPELILVKLGNGDSAVYLNAKPIYFLESFEVAGSRQARLPSFLAETLAEAMGVDLQIVEMDEPKDAEWNWDDVYELLPPSNAEARTDAVKVSHWDSATYTHSDNEPRAEYTMRVSDQREASGQMFIDIEPIDGHVDDMGLGITLEVNNTPGDDQSHVPCVHLSFGSGDLAVSLFQSGLDSFILRPETGVLIMSGTILPNNEHAYSVQGGA